MPRERSSPLLPFLVWLGIGVPGCGTPAETPAPSEEVAPSEDTPSEEVDVDAVEAELVAAWAEWARRGQ